MCISFPFIDEKYFIVCAVLSSSVVSDSVTPWTAAHQASSVHGDSPGKNTGVGSHALLQRIFPTWGLNSGLLHCRWILHQLSHQESPFHCIDIAYFVYLIINWWEWGLFSLFGYYAWFCFEYSCTSFCVHICFHYSCIFTEEGNCWTMYCFTLPSAMYEGSNFITSSATLFIICLYQPF